MSDTWINGEWFYLPADVFMLMVKMEWKIYWLSFHGWLKNIRHKLHIAGMLNLSKNIQLELFLFFKIYEQHDIFKKNLLKHPKDLFSLIVFRCWMKEKLDDLFHHPSLRKYAVAPSAIFLSPKIYGNQCFWYVFKCKNGEQH